VFGVDILINSFKLAKPPGIRHDFVFMPLSLSCFASFGISLCFFRFFPNKSNDEMDHADTK